MSGSAWKRWNWIEQSLIPVVVAIMRTAWLAPLLQLVLNNVFVHPVDVVYPAWWLLALMLGGTALERWLHPQRWGVVAAVALGLLAVPVTWGLALGFTPETPLRWLWAQIVALTDFSIGLPSGLILMVVTILVWRRGLAADVVKYTSVWGSFVLGTLMLGGLMLFRVETLLAIPGMYLNTYMVTFVLAGLLALALLSLTSTLATERRRGSGALTINEYWLLGIASMVLSILLVGWLLGLILAPETVVAVLRFFGPLWDAIAFLLLAIATLIAYLTMWLIAPLVEALYRRVMPVIREFRLDELRAYIFEHTPNERSPFRVDIDWGAILRPLLVVLVIGLGVWLFIRAWRRLRRSSDPDVIETRESILSAHLLKEQLRNLFRRHKAPTTSFFPLDPTGSPRDAIRACYQELLASMQKAGLPRPKGATPYGFDALLGDRWPEDKQLLDALTEEYVRARYAPDEPEAEQVARAQQAWQALQRRANAETARE
jgi:large-conductance mechanosensitive channel